MGLARRTLAEFQRTGSRRIPKIPWSGAAALQRRAQRRLRVGAALGDCFGHKIADRDGDEEARRHELAEGLDALLRQLADSRGMKPGAVMQPVRIALTGGTVSEAVNELLVVVGRDEALARLDAASRGP